MSRSFRFILPLFLLAISIAPAVSQDAPEKPAADKPATEKPATEKPAAEEPAAEDAKTPAAAFKAVLAEWNALDKRLTELKQQYAAADAGARPEIKSQYEELVDQSMQLLPKLKEAGVAAFEADPNKDPEVTRTLIGIVAYDFRRDDYEAALELARKLEAGKCEEPVLFAIAGQAAFNSDDFEAAETYLTRADEAGKLDDEGQSILALIPKQKEKWAAEQAIRKKEAEADDLPRVKLTTSKGPIVVELFENEAPQAVANFVSLVETKFYDGLTFHRVLPGFMAQGGDPEGNGSGGPGYEIYCECEEPDARQHFRGTLSMAHAGKDTGGSQFFLTFKPTPQLDGKHTAFGRVIEGQDVLAKLQRRDPDRASQPTPDKIEKAEVLRKRDHKYEPTKVE
jgi:cyclophilin family peptidyl-prolyl cis-trans isomerase